MAYASRETQKINRASLTATLLINGAVLAALMSAAPELIKLPPKIITIYDVKPEKPPEPLPEPPTPQPRDERVKPPLIKPFVPTPTPPNNPIIELSDGPIVPLGPKFGNGEDTVITPPAPPAPPAVTRPEIDRSAGFQPEYPANKVRLEEEGRVTVRVLVGTNGRVRQVEPVGSPDADFFAATKRHALARWRFTPATRDGVKIEAWRELSLRFELDR